MSTHSVLGNAFGKHRLIAELGRGGMATVYLAASSGPGGFNKLSVLKLLRDLHEQDGVEMFLEEARLAAQLNHPNVVQTYEVGKVGEQYFIAMEFIDGPALNRLRRRVPIPLPIGLYVIASVLDGLRHAHALKGYDGHPLMLVHRDLSPQNVLVTYEGDCKIVDFGIAKALDSPLVTSEGLFRGKLTYMPPEQVRGAQVDQRADVFAVGALLFETITGRRLWQGETELAVAQRLAAGDIPRLVDPRPEVAPELVDLCNWALAPDVEARCPSATVLQVALESHVRNAGLTATRRDLGQLVAATFSADRERLQRVITAQLREGTATPTAQHLALSLPHASYGSSSSSFDEVSAEEAAEVRRGGAEATATPRVPPPAARGQAARPSRSWRALALAAAAVLAVLAGAALALRPSRSAVTAESGRPGGSSAPLEARRTGATGASLRGPVPAASSAPGEPGAAAAEAPAAAVPPAATAAEAPAATLPPAAAAETPAAPPTAAEPSPLPAVAAAPSTGASAAEAIPPVEAGAVAALRAPAAPRPPPPPPPGAKAGQDRAQATKLPPRPVAPAREPGSPDELGF
jgi:serine/threonine-protein kinase